MDIGLAQYLYEHIFHNYHWGSMRLCISISQHNKIIPATMGVKEEIYHGKK